MTTWTQALLGCAMVAVLTSSPALAQQAPRTLSLGTVAQVATGGTDQVFEIQLAAGQGVIVDIIPVIAGTTFPETTPRLRIVGPGDACLRAVPEMDGCPAVSVAPDLEAGAADTLRIAVRADAAGTYRVFLSLPQDPAITHYELLARERSLPAPAQATPIELCAAPPEAMAADAVDPCAQQHSLPASGRSYFSFQADSATPWVQVDMRGVEREGSTTLDSVVELLGPMTAGTPLETLSVIDTNDDYGDGFNSRLRAALPGPGTYVVLARSYAGAEGLFTLAVREFEPPPPRPMQPLALGQSVSATFAAGEVDTFHTYELAAPAGQVLTIDVASDMDTRLSAGFEMNVFDVSTTPPADFAALATNDDTCGTNPQLKLRFEEDETIRVRIEPYAGASADGEYTITAREGAHACPPADMAAEPEPG